MATTAINGCQSHWKSVYTYNKSNHSIKGYLSHWKSVCTYSNAPRESTLFSPTGSMFLHISRATTTSTGISLNGNKCPYIITSATTASIAISLTGYPCPHITRQTTAKGNQSHFKSFSMYNKGS